MALKGNWIDKINGVDENSAEDINQVAHAVIEVENNVGELSEAKADKIMTSPDGTKWVLTVGNDGTVTATKYVGEPVPATGITLNPTALTFNDSANQYITATLTPADSTDEVVWTSSNDGIVIVSGGKVTPIANGTATITATAGSVSATCEVTVNIEKATTYSITRNITNAVGFDDAETIGEGSELLECYVSADEYTMDGATATVTMGGEDITETAWDNGVVNIAEVTGDVVITLDAVKINYVVPTLADFGDGGALVGTYIGSESAIEVADKMLDAEGMEQPVQLRWDFGVSDSVKHLKVSSGVTKWNSFRGISTGKDTLKTVDSYASFPVIVPKQFNALEKYVRYQGTETAPISHELATSIRTLQGLEYPETVTDVNGAYMHMSGLLDGGVIPAHITSMTRAFYGCTNLRRIKVATTADGAASASTDPFYQTFYGVSELDIELALSGGLWSCLRASPNLKWSYKFIDGEPFNSIICFGDSLTGNQSGNYPPLMRNLVPNNAVVHQCGWGGYKSDAIYQNMITDPYSRHLRDDIVVIWHGTNGYGDDGYDGVTAKMVAALEGNQRYLLIPPTAQGAGDEVYESWVATYGAEHVMSMGDWFVNNGYTVSDYLTDGTHFTEEGYALVAQAIVKKISVWL